MRKGFFLISILLLCACTGCRDFFAKSDRVVVAECYGQKLYAEDLAGVFPTDASRMDSLARVNAFIDSWVRRQLLIHQAERTLEDQQLDFTKELQDYRNSLVIYAYETQMIEQFLDTVISEEEISEYYEEHKDNFQLRSTMVKVAYVILEQDEKHLKDFQQLMKDPDTLLLVRLDVLASHFAVASFLEVDSWIRLEDLQNKVPIEIYNLESFFKKNRFVSFEKDNYIYLVRFEDYLLEESVSPLEIESDNIKNIILLKREKDLLSRLNEELYEKAVKEKVFEIY